MAPPSDYSRPRLGPGCRLRTQDGRSIVLFPEGMIRVDGTAQSILQLCDGQRTVLQIAATLERQYPRTDPCRIKEDVGRFLDTLKLKRIVDYE